MRRGNASIKKTGGRTEESVICELGTRLRVGLLAVRTDKERSH
jgi:hypothetical protein